MNFLEELEKLKLRAQGAKDDLGFGLSEGMRVTPEDRRDALWEIRDIEGKSEPPRAVSTMATQPGIDVLRQIKTIHPNAPLPGVSPYSDEFFVMRGKGGMNFGPNAPADLSPGDKAGVERYKRGLREQSFLRKAGFLGGAAASDLVNDSSRSIWWLINAPQAVTNLASELGAAHFSPDLFARREVSLDEATKKGWVNYKQPAINEAALNERVRDISEEAERTLLNKFADGMVDPENPYTDTDFDKDMAVLQEKSKRKALEQLQAEAKDNVGNYVRSRPGVKIRGNRILKNRFNPNLVNAATIIPAALGINAGIGLMGRHEGYQAVVASEEDARRTENALAEVASRYLAGREGRLLEAEDFLLERPDVSMGEYQKYRGYLRDRDIDMNPFDDGKINFGGILKTNPDGIRGAELSFMGKSLPVNDTLMPTIGAAAGTALGAALTNLGSIKMRGGFKRRKGLGKAVGFMPEVLPRNRDGSRQNARKGDGPINRMQAEFDKDDGPMHNVRVLGTVGGMGMAGLAAGNALGTSIEDERRRRNFEDRNPGIDYDTYKTNAKKVLDEKIKIAAANPNAESERGESRVGFSKRSQQAALQTKTLQQQTLIDQIIDEERKARANKALGTQNWALNKAQDIENSIGEGKKKKEEEPYPLI